MTFARTLLVAALLMSPGVLGAQTMETGFLNRTVTHQGVEYAFQVYVPRQYDASKPWPVILALHGGGERGSDGLLQTEVGLGSAIRRHAERYPAIVVFPQTPMTGSWQALGAEVALAALDQSLAEFNSDRSRVYLAGLSMGGNGSWYLAYRHADRFAAAVIVCGWISERRQGLYPPIPDPAEPDPFAAVARRVAALPIWLFHGDADPTVSVDESRRMAAALQAIGANVKYTELAGVAHNAWDPAFRSEELPEWLFAQRKP